MQQKHEQILQGATSTAPQGGGLVAKLADETNRQKLVKRIVDFDPVEFSDEVSPGRAQFLADAILRDFDVTPKVTQ